MVRHFQLFCMNHETLLNKHINLSVVCSSRAHSAQPRQKGSRSPRSLHFLLPTARGGPGRETSVGPGEGWVGPVGGGDGGLVLLGARLVEHRQQLRRVVGQRLQIHHGVRAVTVIAVEDEVSVEVSGVQSGQRQSVAVSRQRGFLAGGVLDQCLTFYLNFWSTVVIFLAEKARVLESLHDDGLDLTSWVYHPDPVGVFVRIWLEQEDVLVY